MSAPLPLLVHEATDECFTNLVKVVIACPLPQQVSMELTKLWIQSLGGTYQKRVGSTTTHVCIEPSQYYSSSHDVRMARSRNIVLVTLGWLEDSYAEGRFVDSCDYDLAALCAHAAPLRGCVIAFTSSYPRSRGVPGFKLVEEHIINLGGICDQASEPIHALTHLCATEEEIRHQGIYVRNVLHRAKSDEDKAFHLVGNGEFDLYASGLN